MALPEVGLQAVMAGLPGFEAGAKSVINAYDTIEKKAGSVEKATSSMGGAFSSLGSGMSNLGGQFAGLGAGVLKFGAIAGGIALAGATALTAGIVALGTSALGEVAKFERMELSIQNLVAREISGGKIIEQETQTRIQLSKQEQAELEKLKGSMDNNANSRDILTARIQEQKERIRQLTEQYGENGLVVIKERAELQGMELDLSDLNKEMGDNQARIEELNNKNGQLVSTLQKVRVGQVSMSEAMEQASPRAQELIKWIQMLAIQSPFTSEGIQAAFQTALAYGFTTEQAQRLTEAEVDFTSATGKGAEAADLIALALGQIQARGKLSAQELRQLSEQGIGTNRILEDMGFTLDDVSNGLVDSDKFIEAVIKDMEIFKGAARAQSGTFSGLLSSLEEIKSVGLREFFTGTFQAIQPYLANFVGFLTNAALETGGIRALGDVLGGYVATALERIGTIIATFQQGGLAVFSKYLGVEGIPLWYELNELITNITSTIGGLSSEMQGPLSSALSNISDNILPTITTVLQFVNENFESFKGAILGVGAVLAAGVFVALIAGILALLTPINLIIAAAALLGAAWVGNWGNIQGITFTAWAIIQPLLSQLWTWLQTNIPVALQFLSDAWTGYLLPAITTVSDFISGTLFPLLTEWWTWLSATLVEATNILSDIWLNTLLPAITAVWGFISTSLLPLFISIGNFMKAVFSKAVEALAGLWQNILLPALRDVWKFIQENIVPVFTSLIEKFTGESGLSPTLKSFTENVLPPFKKGMDAITEAIKQATDFFKDLTSIVSNFELPEVLQPGSPTPFELALTGIANAAQNAGQALSGMITQSTLDSLLGLNRNIFSTGNAISIAQRKLYKFFEARNLEEGKRSLATRQMTEVFRANQAQILGAANPVEMFRQLARQAGILGEGAGFSGQAGAIAQGGFGAFLEAFQNASDQLQEAQQQAYIEAGRTALNIGNRLTGIIEGSAEILDNRVEALQQIVDAGLAEATFEGQIISAVQAQEMLNQALEEQREIQDDLMQMKQNEAKLDFLGKQLDLIETINDAGLNVEDILGGLVLGMDASIPDLIAATNNLITAMIDQVNADLQLASPSKVMAEKGRLTGQGFIEGILGQVPNIAGAIQSAIAGPVVNAPVAAAGAAAGSVTHIYQMGGNNINNGMSEAEFEARTLNVIRRNLR